ERRGGRRQGWRSDSELRQPLFTSLSTLQRFDASALRRFDASALQRSDASALQRSDASALQRSDASALQRLWPAPFVESEIFSTVLAQRQRDPWHFSSSAGVAEFWRSPVLSSQHPTPG